MTFGRDQELCFKESFHHDLNNLESLQISWQRELPFKSDQLLLGAFLWYNPLALQSEVN